MFSAVESRVDEYQVQLTEQVLTARDPISCMEFVRSDGDGSASG